MTPVDLNLIPKSFYNVETQTLNVSQKQAEAVQAGIQAKLDTLPPAQKEAFLKLTANLAPGDVDTPAKLGIILNVFEQAAAIVQNPTAPVMAFIGDLAKLLARVMIEQASEQRQNALNDRLAARETAKGELMSQAQQMDNAAAKMMSGALTSIITAAIGGAISIGGSLTGALGTMSQLGKMGTQAKATETATKQMSQANDEISNLSKLMKGTTDPKELSSLNQKLDAAKNAQQAASTAQQSSSNLFNVANTKSSMIGGFGQAGSSLGDTTSRTGAGADARQQAEAKGMDAQGARDAADAQVAQQQADLKKELQDSLSDMIKQIINFIKELKEAEVDAMRALTKV